MCVLTRVYAAACTLLLAPIVPLNVCKAAQTEVADSVDTVVVTATRSEMALSTVPESLTVLDSARLRDTPAQSVDDVLRTVPSVNLPPAASYQLHPTANSVSMRGLGGSRALVLLDGVPLNDPFFGYLQWSLLPIEDVRRIEVVRGGGATLWGNYAMGGVINILTRIPDRQSLSVDLGGGAYGTYWGNLHGAWVPSDRLRVGFDATGNGTDGFQSVLAVQRSPLDVPTSFRARNLQLASQFEPTEQLSGSLRVGWHELDQRLHSPLSTNRQSMWNLSGDLRRRVGAQSLTATLFHIDSEFRTDNTDTPDDAAPGTAEFVQNRHRTPVNTTGGSLLWSLQGSSVLRLLSAGADYQQLRGTDTGAIFDGSGMQIRTDVGRGAQRFAGVFVQASLVPHEDLEILASARYQYFQNYDGFDGSPGGLGRTPRKSSSSFNPRISMRYAISPLMALRVAGYRAFRAPTLDNLYRTFSTPFGVFYGNAALKPERLKGAEAGADFTAGALRAQLTYYYNNIDDLLTSRNLDFSELPPGFFFGSRNINAGSARARGFEAELNRSFAAHWDGTLAYTYASSIITENPLDPLSVGKQLGGVPRQSASGALSYRGAGWRIAARLRWIDKSYSDNAQTLAVDEHVIADLSAAYAVNRHLEPYIKVENLFARQYIADNSGFSPPQLGTPLTVFAGLRASFE